MSFVATFRHNSCRLTIILGLAYSICGCGGTEADSKGWSATGTVDYEGNPLAAGEISFMNIGTGNAASGSITDGTFSISAVTNGSQGVLILGKEKPDGEPTWQWSGKADVPEGGLKDVKFTITAKDTKPASNPNPDD